MPRLRGEHSWGQIFHSVFVCVCVSYWRVFMFLSVFVYLWQRCVGACISWTYWSQRISTEFLVWPSKVKCCSLSLFLLFFLFPFSHPLSLPLCSGERGIETLELRSHWVGVSQLKCQTRRYHLGVYLKWKTVCVNLHLFSVTCGFGMNITGLLGVFIMFAFMRNCPESQKVMATLCLCCLLLTDRRRQTDKEF